MSDEESEAELWEEGSRDDEIRNTFVIPQIARIFEAHRPARVLDIGPGTGYVSRSVDDELTYRPHWTFVDLRLSRLELARTLKPKTMSLTLIVGNVFNWPLPDDAFEAILISFTLLEISDIDRLFSLIRDKTGPGALLVIVLPDSWIDVLERSRADPDVIPRFISGSVEIPKLDKFTNQEYPFFAVRSETVIQTVLKNGFDLIGLEHGVIGAVSAMVLTFRRGSRP